MPKLTREQYNKWDTAAQNDFHFSVDTYLMRNEKELVKVVYTNAEKTACIRFTLEYTPEYEKKTNSYGCSWNVRTGRQIPALHVATWQKSTSTESWISHGIGKTIHIAEPVQKKNYALLCKLSGTINTADYMDYAALPDHTGIPAGIII